MWCYLLSSVGWGSPKGLPRFRGEAGQPSTWREEYQHQIKRAHGMNAIVAIFGPNDLPQFAFLFFFFWLCSQHEEVPGQGLNVCYSSNPSSHSDSARSFTHCARRELLVLLFKKKNINMGVINEKEGNLQEIMVYGSNKFFLLLSTRIWFWRYV